MFNADQNLIAKWAPVLDHEGTAPITDPHKRAVTARILENQEIACREEHAAQNYSSLTEAAPSNETGNVANFDPILISLVRRAMPNLIAYDVAGVQPMTGPTGLVFCMKAIFK